MKTPTFFQTAAQQRLLVALAHLGPMQIAHACEIANIAEIASAKALISSGVIVRWRPHAHRAYIALNSSFPAASELIAFLHMFPRPERGIAIPPPRADVAAMPRRTRCADIGRLFGGQTRTTLLLALEGFGGHADSLRFQRVLGHEHRVVVRGMMNNFQRDQLVVPGRRLRNRRRSVEWNAALPQVDAFRDLLTVLLREHPNLRTATAKIELDLRASKQRPVARVIDWREKVVGVDLPGPWRPPEDGAPLLFGSDAKRRVLAALISEPLRLTDLERIARTRDKRAMLNLERIGVITCRKMGRWVVVGLAPSLPILSELKRLLLKVEDRYPSCHRGRQDYSVAPLEPTPWRGSLDTLFGPPSRSLPFITLGAVGEVDASSLARLLPQFERQTINRTLYMFCNLGVLTSRREGNAISYRLNERFCADEELKLLLSAIHAILPSYESRAKMEERLMTPNRLKMRMNDRRRRSVSRKRTGAEPMAGVK